MSYLDAHNELRSRFASAWGDTTPVDWPNVKFKPPTDGTTWTRFRVLDGDSRQLTIGGPTNPHRQIGVIVISIFTPQNVGDATPVGLADIAAGIFRNWMGTNIVCRQPAIKNLGPDGHGYYQLNVEVPFHRDEIF